MMPEKSQRDAVQPTPPWTRRDLTLVAILIVAGLVLRLIGLNEGLWIDEINTLLNHVRQPAAEIIESYRSRNNHVLYSLIAHYSVAWLGEAAWTLRLPAMLLGVATIPAAYQLGRQLASRNEAFLAGALLAVSYHHVWFSQNARGYTGLLLGAVLMSVYFVRLLATDKPGHRPILAYAIVAALACWIHLSGALVVIAHGLIWLLVISPVAGRQRTDLRFAALFALLLAGLLSLLLYAPLLTHLWEEFAVDSSDAAMAANPENPHIWRSFEWLRSEIWNAALSAVPGGWPTVILGALVMIAGTCAYLRQGIVPASVLILPGIVTVAATLRYSEIVFPRFLFSSAVFFLLILVRGGFVLSQAVFPKLSLRQVTLIGLAVSLLFAVMVPGAWRPKQEFAATAEYIAARRVPGDAVACGPRTYMSLHTYLGMECQRAFSKSELAEIEKAQLGTWFIYAMPELFRYDYPELWSKVHIEYTPVEKLSGTVNGGDIVIMLKSSGDAPPGD
jgi:hypothetical protein